MQDFLFQKDSYSLTNSEKYNLSIQVSLDGFSFLIQNNETSAIELISYTPLNLSGDYGLLKKAEEFIGANAFLEKNYHLVTIIICNNQARLLPTEYSNEKIYRQLPGLKAKDTKGMQLASTAVTNKYHLVFPVNSELYHYFNFTFPGCIFIHEMLPLLKFSIRENEPEKLIVDCVFRNQYISISAVADKDVIFFNSFNIRSQYDILFFIASVKKILPDADSELYCSGNIDQNSGLIYVLKKYFANISLRNVRNIQPGTGLPANLPAPEIFSLLANHQI